MKKITIKRGIACLTLICSMAMLATNVYAGPSDTSDHSQHANKGPGKIKKDKEEQERAANGKWVQEGDRWQYMYKDNAVSDKWFKIGKDYYRFDENGYMMTGWYLYGTDWYYMNPEEGADQGKMKKGWVEYNGDWYYLYEANFSGINAGAMAVDITINNYTLDANGKWVP